MTKVIRSVLIAVTMAACGGSDPQRAVQQSSADLRQSQEGQAPAGKATVYVVHGINGKDVAASLPASLPVDVSVNGACALTRFQFGKIAGPLQLPAGSYDLAVHLAATPACSGAVAASAKGVGLKAGDNVSVVADLSSPPGKPQLAFFANDVRRTEGKARVVARHAANFGAVDVLLDREVAFPGVVNGQQGAAVVRPGPHVVAIAPAGSDTAVFSAQLKLDPRNVYVAYAVGTPANGTFQVILQQIPAAKNEPADDESEGEDESD